MIFNCGQSFEEKNRRRKEWHDFFAILPKVVIVENGYQKCAWLETIQRKSTVQCDYDGCWWVNEYRMKP